VNLRYHSFTTMDSCDRILINEHEQSNGAHT
jgi:hypothetical protein